MKKIIQFIVLLLLWSNISAQDTYKNPIALTYDSYGIGDPSVFKWMGKFYLLASSGSGAEKGMQMWQSEDLVNWTHTGAIIGSGPGGAYWAPEVIYYEGTFYLYTCQDEGGANFNLRAFKYELPLDGRAKTPLGEFSLITNDLVPGQAYDIDPYPFRDDNGDLYIFFSSRKDGIKYVKMDTPVSTGGNSVHNLSDCKTNITTQWTEGPTVHKIDGRYYMTYCGNDVADPRYTISSASGTSIAGLREDQNVFIQHTTGNWNGTGHNQWVLGPDLQTYYTTYHVKMGEGMATNGRLHRRLMLDKIWVDGGKLHTEAPSFDEKPIPALPDWSDDFNRTSIGGNWSGPSNGTSSLKDNFLLRQNSRGNGGSGKWWSKTISSETTSSDFVVEFNLKLNDAPQEGDSDYAVNTWPKFGVFVSQETEGANEEKKMIYVALNTKTGNIETLISYNNNATWEGDGVTLNGSDLTKWHTIRIKKEGLNLKVYYDNMLKIEKTLTSDIGGGHFGFITENSDADFGWVGFSNIN
ncbi:MAG: family 43 glycosylhydrolase [Flavobacteriales bacterium]|nr:family 43 glycosylhydrolase [Flavobacteriales bacterium]